MARAEILKKISVFFWLKQRHQKDISFWSISKLLQIVCEGEFWCLIAVTFIGQKVSAISGFGIGPKPKEWGWLYNNYPCSNNPLNFTHRSFLRKHYWAAKQQISWFIAPWWIFIPFVWPSSSLLLPLTSSWSEHHLHFASIKVCQASWTWYSFSR